MSCPCDPLHCSFTTRPLQDLAGGCSTSKGAQRPFNTNENCFGLRAIYLQVLAPWLLIETTPLLLVKGTRIASGDTHFLGQETAKTLDHDNAILYASQWAANVVL